MKRIERSSSRYRHVWLAAVIVLAGVIASGGPVAAQGSNDAIDQAQRAVQERITSQQGGQNLTVQFARDARTEFPSNAQVRVQGTGSTPGVATGTTAVVR